MIACFLLGHYCFLRVPVFISRSIKSRCMLWSRLFRDLSYEAPEGDRYLLYSRTKVVQYKPRMRRCVQKVWTPCRVQPCFNLLIVLMGHVAGNGAEL